MVYRNSNNDVFKIFKTETEACAYACHHGDIAPSTNPIIMENYKTLKTGKRPLVIIA